MRFIGLRLVFPDVTGRRIRKNPRRGFLPRGHPGLGAVPRAAEGEPDEDEEEDEAGHGAAVDAGDSFRKRRLKGRLWLPGRPGADRQSRRRFQ